MTITEQAAEIYREAVATCHESLRNDCALVAIHHGRAVTVPWASSLGDARPLCPNHLLYWEALRWAIDREVAFPNWVP